MLNEIPEGQEGSETSTQPLTMHSEEEVESHSGSFGNNSFFIGSVQFHIPGRPETRVPPIYRGAGPSSQSSRSREHLEPPQPPTNGAHPPVNSRATTPAASHRSQSHSDNDPAEPLPVYPDVQAAPPASGGGGDEPPHHHVPNVSYHATYYTNYPPPPAAHHQRLRRIMVGTYDHLSVFAEQLGSEEFLHRLHGHLHNLDTPINYAIHDRLFTLTSEWGGNPFLFSLERMYLEQIRYFLDHIDLTTDWVVAPAIDLIDDLIAFRIDGPDAAVIVQQRLLGLYGRVGAALQMD